MTPLLDFEDEAPALTREYVERRRRADGTAVPTEEGTFGHTPVEDGFALHVLASGSKGNASLVRFGGHAVLIDCGISKKALFERCAVVEFDPAAIDAILVTHEHSDHTKGIDVLVRGLAKQGAHPPIVTTAAIHEASAPLRKIEELTEIRHVRTGDAFTLAGMLVASFATSHDGVESMGFRFEADRPDGTRDALGFVTDTGVMTDAAFAHLADVRLLAIESNHDPRLLQTGPYPSYLKRRVAGATGHLSNEQSAEALERLLSDRLEAIAGMHLSETNNTPQHAERAAHALLARTDHPAQFWAASQHRPLTL